MEKQTSELSNNPFTVLFRSFENENMLYHRGGRRVNCNLFNDILQVGITAAGRQKFLLYQESLFTLTNYNVISYLKDDCDKIVQAFLFNLQSKGTIFLKL